MFKQSRLTPLQKKLAAERKGRWAETLAVMLLTLKGYRILARRFRSSAGEIDIIAAKRRTLIAVEVKARPTMEAGMYALSAAQQQRIWASLVSYAQSHPRYQDYDLRLDFVVARPRSLPYHLPDASRP